MPCQQAIIFAYTELHDESQHEPAMKHVQYMLNAVDCFF